MEKDYVASGRTGLVVIATDTGRELRAMHCGLPPPPGGGRRRRWGSLMTMRRIAWADQHDGEVGTGPVMDALALA